MEERIITSNLLDEDKELSIRPESLDEYVGQSEIKENLRVFIKSALIIWTSRIRKNDSSIYNSEWIRKQYQNC